jgi:hypothetical protein
VHLWQPPFYVIGSLLLDHLNNTLPVRALFFSGLDLVLVLLAALWALRRMSHSAVDLRGHVPPASPLRKAGLVCVVTIALTWICGVPWAGFSFGNSLWQIFRVIYLPCVFLLFCAGLRGPADARPLGIVLLVAALLRACLAIYMRHLFPDTELMPHATTHADSMLFADAFLLVVAIFFERPTRKNLALAVATLPIFIGGMIANNRRLVWVELGLCLVVFYLITPMTRLKRRLAQGLLLSLPLIIIYVAIGWSHSTGVFAPMRTIRSVVDSQADSSTLWRDLENYDLYYTLRGHPLGTGFGHPYEEKVTLPDISHLYTLYRFAPHNSLLGLAVYGGPLGFAGIWALIPLGLFFAARCFRASPDPANRTAALASIGVLVTYAIHCYGDMALGTWTSVFTVGPALALIAKQSVATGAWPLRAGRVAAAFPSPQTSA